jgi:phasin family protein
MSDGTSRLFDDTGLADAVVYSLAMRHEPLFCAYNANVETLLAVATVHVSAFDKLAAIHRIALQSTLEDSIANAQRVFGAKDLHELAMLQASFGQRAIEKTLGYAKDLFEVATAAKAELSRVAERGSAQWSANLTTLLDDPTISAIAATGLEPVAHAMLETSDSAGAKKEVTRVAKPAKEIAEANVAMLSRFARSLANSGSVAGALQHRA